MDVGVRELSVITQLLRRTVNLILAEAVNQEDAGLRLVAQIEPNEPDDSRNCL